MHELDAERLLGAQHDLPDVACGRAVVFAPDDDATDQLTRVHRLAERLKAGGVYVNGARQNLPHTPFGGLGISGYGKEGGRAGIDEFLRYKTVSIIEPQ